MLHCTGLDVAVQYRLEPAPPREDSIPLGTTTRAGLPSFLSFVQRSFADILAALERVLGPLERLPNLVLRFDCPYATADALARRRRGIRFVGRNYAAELPPAELEPFSEQRQTIEGWWSEATAALLLTGLWSRSREGVEAFLLHAALASNLLNWWARRELLRDSDLLLGLRQVSGRIVTLPARVVAIPPGVLRLVLPSQHPDARRLAVALAPVLSYPV
jgi:hypothetical protein